MRADTGPIGGDLSHEFIVLADTGESAVFCHKGLLDKDILGRDIDYEPTCSRSSTTGRRSTPRPTRCTTAAFEKMPEDERLDGARHRGRPHLLFRHQILRADEGDGHRPRRRAGHGRDGLLRHRRVAPGRRRSSRPAMTRTASSGPNRSRRSTSASINLKPATPHATRPASELYAALKGAGIDVLYDDRDERPAPSSPTWT